MINQQNFGRPAYDDARVQPPPPSTALQGIIERVNQVRSNLQDIHGIADRACGSIASDGKVSPRPVPNGMLDELIEGIDDLLSLSDAARTRLSRIA